MMQRVAIIAICLWLCHAASFNGIEDLPAEFKELVPKEIKDFFKSLTNSERAVVNEIIKNHASYKNEDEVLAAIKEKSPTLAKKVEKLYAVVRGKLDALGEEARPFVDEVIAGARKIHAHSIAGKKPNLAELNEKVQNAFSTYNALSDAAKEDLHKHSPFIAGIFKNEKFKKMAQTLAANN